MKRTALKTNEGEFDAVLAELHEEGLREPLRELLPRYPNATHIITVPGKLTVPDYVEMDGRGWEVLHVYDPFAKVFPEWVAALRQQRDAKLLTEAEFRQMQENLANQAGNWTKLLVAEAD